MFLTTLSAAHHLLALLWPWLPQFTLALKFATALISFCFSVGLLIRRLCRWARLRHIRRRSTTPTRPIDVQRTSDIRAEDFGH